jgi:hypothetical protein
MIAFLKELAAEVCAIKGERDAAVQKYAAISEHMAQVHEVLHGNDTVLTLEAAQLVVAAYDKASAERDAAVRAATAWKRSAKLNKELWNDEKEVHAQRCHDVDTLRARLAACEKIVGAAKRYTDSAPYEVAHYSNDANVAYNVLRTAVATATRGYHDDTDWDYTYAETQGEK